MYQLKVSEEQAQVIADALELYARVGMGQLAHITEHPDIRSRIFKNTEISLEILRGVFEMVKQTVFNLPVNCYHSLGCPEISDKNRVAYDLVQVIRHRLAWDRAGNPPERDYRTMYGVIYDTPMHFAKEPLSKIDRLDL